MKTKIFADFQVYLYRNFTPLPRTVNYEGSNSRPYVSKQALTLLKLINKRKIIPKLTTEERIFVVEKYIESNIINNIRQHFRQQFTFERLPVKGQSNVTWQNNNFGTEQK